jgi:flavin-dependent dehydrogenase
VKRCDVLVVGGGPAGSACAWRLRRSGLAVRVIDRARFPRDKVCAGWITPQVLEELEIEPEEYRKGRVLQPVRGFAVGLLGRPAARVDYGEVVSYAIRRCEFDHYLLLRSQAGLETGEPVRSLRRAGGRWIANEAFEAGLLVGAGGHFCPVARELNGTASAPEPIVTAQEVEFQLDGRQRLACGVQPELPELSFSPDLRGYGWAVRKGDFLNVGLGRQDPRGLAEHVQGFLAELARLGKLPPGAPRRLRGHAYRLYGAQPRRVVGDRVLLLGDAAGLADARSGEGIRPAIESGLLAAGVIARAGGDWSREALEGYASALAARFGRAAGHPGAGPSAWIPPRLRPWLASRLLASPWFARAVVLDRWFLHRAERALAAA